MMINLEEFKRNLLMADERINNILLLVSVRQGLIYMIPILLIGSFALIFISLPIPSYQKIMEGIFGVQWKSIFLSARNGTFNILSLMMVITISYSYAVERCKDNHYEISPLLTAIVSLSSYIIISNISDESFSIDKFGAIGVFIAIFMSTSSAALFIKLCSIRQFRIKAFTSGANSVFNYALTSILPAAITIAVFVCLMKILSDVFGINDIQGFISLSLSNLFLRMESSIKSAIMFIFFIHFFWIFGMHGNNIIEPVAQSIFAPAVNTNNALISMGKAPTEIFTKTFFDTFVFMGGCGSILCLVCAILIAGKHKNLRRHAKMSFIPVLFNINEMMVFGIPIVLNPVYIIPFLYTPILLTILSSAAMVTGMVPYTVHSVEWTTPIFLSGYMSTGSIRGSLLQLINLILGTFCYIPFVILSEKLTGIHMKNSLQNVCAVLQQRQQQGLASDLLSRNDEVGSISRFIYTDLEEAIRNNELALFYQPQVNAEGHVFGVEALLRWKHEMYGYIYPPLVIALAEEGQIINKLGNWILDTACKDLKELNNLGFDDIVVAVNISPSQLENKNFTYDLKEIITKHNIEPHMLEIEITEQTALTARKEVIEGILAIKEMGIKLGMDDFGMGHSSLMYLKEYKFDTIKIDGSLVRELLINSNCRDIISSIIYLSKSLHFSTIAEFVEREEQRAVLYELECDKYQGYLYSPAVPFDKLIEFIENCNGKKLYSSENYIET